MFYNLTRCFFFIYCTCTIFFSPLLLSLNRYFIYYSHRFNLAIWSDKLSVFVSFITPVGFFLPIPIISFGISEQVNIMWILHRKFAKKYRKKDSENETYILKVNLGLKEVIDRIKIEGYADEKLPDVKKCLHGDQYSMSSLVCSNFMY